MGLLQRLKARARHLEAETLALYFAAYHPGTPWYAKLLAAAIAVYAVSPIDLIPDFIPVLGYLDDLILIPLGIALVVKLVPPPVLAECRARAQEALASGRPVSWVAGVAVILVWLVLAALLAAWAYHAITARP
jgi:uncharacterized membrane protein YkvA (DUF1232 family)